MFNLIISVTSSICIFIHISIGVDYMERLVGEYCVIKYLDRIYLYQSFSLSDLNFFKKQIRHHNMSTKIQYDKDFDFYRVIIEE